MSQLNDVSLYLEAATRHNTRRSYQAAVRHFEVEWGGFLPATADSLARYLAHYASTLAINTLQQRLAGLAQWHVEHGFADPTKSPIVRKVLKGIRAVHPAQEKRAKPFQIDQLEQVDDWLRTAAAQAAALGDHAGRLRHLRDRAIFLLGFWRGFRGDELTRLCIEHVTIEENTGMSCFLPRSKGDRGLKGVTFRVPALSRLCSVIAYQEWTIAAGLHSGPAFRAIDRWGHVSEAALHIDSLVPLLRSTLGNAGVSAPQLYSAHSLRRGFASWASANGWDLRVLMEHVGWKNAQSAMRYIDSDDPFNQQRIERTLATGRT